MAHVLAGDSGNASGSLSPDLPITKGLVVVDLETYTVCERVDNLVNLGPGFGSVSENLVNGEEPSLRFSGSRDVIRTRSGERYLDRDIEIAPSGPLVVGIFKVKTKRDGILGVFGNSEKKLFAILRENFKMSFDHERLIQNMLKHSDDLRVVEFVLEYFLQFYKATAHKSFTQEGIPVKVKMHNHQIVSVDIDEGLNVIGGFDLSVVQISSESNTASLPDFSNIDFKPQNLKAGALAIGAIADFLLIKNFGSKPSAERAGVSLLGNLGDDQLLKQLYNFRSKRHDELEPLIAAIGEQSLYIAYKSLQFTNDGTTQIISLIYNGDLTAENTSGMMFGVKEKSKYVLENTYSGFGGVVSFTENDGHKKYFVLIRNISYDTPVDFKDVVAALALLKSGRIGEVNDDKKGRAELIKAYKAIYGVLNG